MYLQTTAVLRRGIKADRISLVLGWLSPTCCRKKDESVFITTNEIPGELLGKNMISWQVKITCDLHTGKDHRCYGYIINHAFHSKWFGISSTVFINYDKIQYYRAAQRYEISHQYFLTHYLVNTTDHV